jgi:hypothetical protein
MPVNFSGCQVLSGRINLDLLCISFGSIRAAGPGGTIMLSFSSPNLTGTLVTGAVESSVNSVLRNALNALPASAKTQEQIKRTQTQVRHEIDFLDMIDSLYVLLMVCYEV